MYLPGMVCKRLNVSKKVRTRENKYLYNPEKLRFFEPLAFRGSSKNCANHRFAIFRDGKELQDDLGLDWSRSTSGISDKQAFRCVPRELAKSRFLLI